MLDVVKYVAAICAPTMAVVARLSDSSDDRRDRGRLGELIRLQGQMQDRLP
jgi:hypothetical protein